MNAARLQRIAVVIPCYAVRARILGVLGAIGPEVAAIYVVDDACPESTGQYVAALVNDDARARVIRTRNPGVGGATMRGYAAAMADGMDILVKLDGDGQMDPARIPTLVRPLLEGKADYAKGNRFFDLDDVAHAGGAARRQRDVLVREQGGERLLGHHGSDQRFHGHPCLGVPRAAAAEDRARLLLRKRHAVPPRHAARGGGGRADAGALRKRKEQPARRARRGHRGAPCCAP